MQRDQGKSDGEMGCKRPNVGKRPAKGLENDDKVSKVKPKRPKRRQQQLGHGSEWFGIKVDSFVSRVLSYDIFKIKNESTSGEQVTGLFGEKKTVQETPPTSTEPSLRNVPQKFSSSQEYAQVFLPLIVEETLEESKVIVSGSSNRLHRSHVAWTGKTSSYLDKGKSRGKPTNSDKEEDPKVTTLQLDFVIEKVVCANRQTLDSKWTGFQKSRDRRSLIEKAEHGVLRRRKMKARSVACPSQICNGDLLVVSDDKTSVPRRLTNSTVLALACSGPRFHFQRVSRELDPAGVQYEIIVRVDVHILKTARLPKFIYVWKVCNVVTGWREYNAVASAVGTPGSRYKLLNTLLKGKEEYNAVLSTRLDPMKITGMTTKLRDSICKRYNRSQQKAIFFTSVNLKGFTLIQGPPGTGKTTTLLAMINVLHLSVYQRYYNSFLPSLETMTAGAPKQKRLGRSNSVDSQEQALQMMPHMLVTAPSNTAVDNIIKRLLETKFLDGECNEYLPSIVRVGRRSADDGPLAAVSMEGKVDQIREYVKKLPLPVSEVIAQFKDAEKQVKADMDYFSGKMDAYLRQMRALQNAFKMEKQTSYSDGDQVADDIARRTMYDDVIAKYNDTANMFTKAREKLVQHRLERRKCTIISEGRNVVSKLQDLILEDAQIVFVTLSSSALEQICEWRARFKFEIVVVDEAAQATEPSILVPLQHNVDHCVLLGDPKQLPATVMSKEAQSKYYQQSLFERLQEVGHESYLLNTQYRCHPLISAFPSKEFYHGKLLDGEKVCQPTYHLPCVKYNAFQPLTFMNISSSRESRGSTSYRNIDEASLARNIVETLRLAPGLDKEMEPYGIGVITPYREQLDTLKQAFRDTDILSSPNLILNTVDGFQGSEFDIIILSCVRAVSEESGRSQGVGFLNDQRRLNVAITRARYMLIVIGQEASLKRSALW
eukprot:CAMPEP_0203756330 /NCGR_PEP_ID=MMETSP0098-20131031/9629_1 /ASSEMBLY_ACC=CAM_ASM_000208 /TAXON_ID=96639 /ORGANISM=" , Strain NY0313808BC1" /LENGTH=939 /DNA_ID=CAMNT_0050648169 /DNA_START=108 /DNA_END=2924 /DNA_ORIENTATION=+